MVDFLFQKRDFTADTSRSCSESLIRRTSFPLKAGHPAAYLYTENTEYRYMENLDAPKKWFQLHADAVLRIYGYQANINKEDLFLSALISFPLRFERRHIDSTLFSYRDSEIPELCFDGQPSASRRPCKFVFFRGSESH